MLESNFQRNLKKEITARYPGCYILKNDPGMIDAIPDLTILYKDKWAMLEVKKDEAAMKHSLKKQPNQSFRLNELNDMSFARFIYPEIKEAVLSELDRKFKA